MGTYTVTATSTADTSKSASATVTVASGSATYAEVESNGTLAAANAVGNAVTKITGFVGTTTDVDYFKVAVNAGATLTVKMTGPAKDYDLYLYNSAGTQVASSTGSSSTESATYKNTGAAAATFYIKVNGYKRAYSTTAGYTLTLTR